MSEIPIAHADSGRTDMCSLNNHLCLSEKKSNSQEIWSLNSHKVWEKTYSILCDLGFRMVPLTLFNKTKLLFLYPYTKDSCLMVHDTITAVSYPSYMSRFGSSYFFHSKLDLYLVEDSLVFFPKKRD